MAKIPSKEFVKIYRVLCRGKKHRVGLTKDGKIVALDHDSELELRLEKLGGEVTECELLRRVWDALGPSLIRGMGPHGLITGEE